MDASSPCLLKTSVLVGTCAAILSARPISARFGACLCVGLLRGLLFAPCAGGCVALLLAIGLIIVPEARNGGGATVGTVCVVRGGGGGDDAGIERGGGGGGALELAAAFVLWDWTVLSMALEVSSNTGCNLLTSTAISSSYLLFSLAAATCTSVEPSNMTFFTSAFRPLKLPSSVPLIITISPTQTLSPDPYVRSFPIRLG